MNIQELVAYLALFFVLSLPAHADLNFEYVDGESVGISQVLSAHVNSYSASNGQNAWLWSSASWCDSTGCYIQVSFHNSGAGFIFERQPDGTYVDVTPANQGNLSPPGGNAVILADLDDNGLIDVIEADDECSSCTTILRNADGSWTYDVDYGLNGSNYLEVIDINGDGLPDLDGPRWDRLNVRDGTYTGWETVPKTTEELLSSANAPQAVIDRAIASEAEGNRYHSIKVFPIAGDFVVTYSGSYGGSVTKWTMIVRNGAVVFDLFGEASRPMLIDGDPAFLLRNGPRGLYVRDASGQYTSGTLPNGVRNSLNLGGYIWRTWSIDFDGDGDDDLLLNGGRGAKSYLLNQKPDGSFGQHKLIHGVDGWASYPADVDGDGDIDVVSAGPGTAATSNKRNNRDFSIYYNNSTVTDPADPTDPVPDEPTDPTPTVPEILADAAAHVADAEVCAAQADTACTQAAIDAAQAALTEGEQSLPF